MTTHLSARLAWHMDGWDGNPCRNPAANAYCIGQYSYPGEMIAEQRELRKSEAGEVACRSCRLNDDIPPCIYGINAFGTNQLTAYATPPDFFHDGTETRRWPLPPSTVAVWPYEVMYGEDVQKGERSFDYPKRLQNAKDFFAQLEPNRSLVFYYANYSNPFSDEERRRYVVVGVSRLKELGQIMYFQGCSDKVKEKYAGGFVWQMNVTSHYPDQGLRIPYHRYTERPEVLERILFVPDNPRDFKFAAREVSDDDALSLVERFIEIAAYLREIGDDSENWDVRIVWLQSLVAELWRNRGLYPGLPVVLDCFGFAEAVQWFKQRVEAGAEREAKDALFAFLDSGRAGVSGLALDATRVDDVRRQWRLRSDEEQRLLRDVLPRFDLAKEQVGCLLSDKRLTRCSVSASFQLIAENPYLLSEQYVGSGPDDTISFSKIDHGMFPSPELGALALAKLDDRRRLRALCVDRLTQETTHTFVPATQVIADVNRHMSHVPEWKRHEFRERYLQVDEQGLSQTLTLRETGGRLYVYLKSVYEDEREIEARVQELANRPDIRFRSPVTEATWHSFLYNGQSDLATKRPDDYEAAIRGQVEVCQKIFVRPVAVLGGTAGTGKTTAITALIQAIEKAHGAGTSFQLLAPTGKAADRIRAITGKPAATIHSFLASKGWLNDNFTFRREGGRCEEGVNTYIVDEASMVDLGLMAALFRAINWNSVQRLILVGDPNQLPPIGRGRVFADVIDWLRESQPQSVGLLVTNMRQMENRLRGRGTTILDLASLYERRDQSAQSDEDKTARAEEVLKRVQEGGDVDLDLRVLYWNGQEDLAKKLVDTIVADMGHDTQTKLDPERAHELWNAAFQRDGSAKRPEYQQVISPYRGEPFGTENLNALLQRHAQGGMLDKVGNLGGVTLFDKVIQYRNRGKSDSLSAYNAESRQVEPIEIFNGELGFVKPHGFDSKDWLGRFFWFRRLQVVFSRKEKYWVNYGSDLGQWPNKRYIRSERVEDNLELAYAISVHKAQGSDFDRVYFVVPKHKRALLSRELFYTGLTRATRHCTLLIEEDMSPLFSMLRPEASHLIGINSSLFAFRPVPDEWLARRDWYEEGKIHKTLASIMVRSKSEVIIANLLTDRGVPFRYEVPLFAPDGTFYLPDFTVIFRGQEYYWEHWGNLSERYRKHRKEKETWYARFFPDQLVTTEESGNLSPDAQALIERLAA